jgi:hypothetical protein
MLAAGKLSDQAYREAFREYQSMVKNHFQNRGEEPNE